MILIRTIVSVLLFRCVEFPVNVRVRVMFRVRVRFSMEKYPSAIILWKLYTSVTFPLERIHWWKENTVTLKKG